MSVISQQNWEKRDHGIYWLKDKQIDYRKEKAETADRSTANCFLSKR